MELKHYGIFGMHWGIRRYQPYPKGQKPAGAKEVGEAAKNSYRQLSSGKDKYGGLEKVKKDGVTYLTPTDLGREAYEHRLKVPVGNSGKTLDEFSKESASLTNKYYKEKTGKDVEFTEDHALNLDTQDKFDAFLYASDASRSEMTTKYGRDTMKQYDKLGRTIIDNFVARYSVSTKEDRDFLEEQMKKKGNN